MDSSQKISEGETGTTSEKLVVVGPDILKKLGIFKNINKSAPKTKTGKKSDQVKTNLQEGSINSKSKLYEKGCLKNVKNNRKMQDFDTEKSVSDGCPRKSGRKNAGAGLSEILKKQQRKGKKFDKVKAGESTTDSNKLERSTVSSVNNKNNIVISKNSEEAHILMGKPERKGRKRKRKSSVDINCEQVETKSENVSYDNVKLKTSDCVSDVKKVDVLPEILIPKKRRGRPRKINIMDDDKSCRDVILVSSSSVDVKSNNSETPEKKVGVLPESLENNTIVTEDGNRNNISENSTPVNDNFVSSSVDLNVNSEQIKCNSGKMFNNSIKSKTGDPVKIVKKKGRPKTKQIVVSDIEENNKSCSVIENDSTVIEKETDLVLTNTEKTIIVEDNDQNISKNGTFVNDDYDESKTNDDLNTVNDIVQIKRRGRPRKKIIISVNTEDDTSAQDVSEINNDQDIPINTDLYPSPYVTKRGRPKKSVAVINYPKPKLFDASFLITDEENSDADNSSKSPRKKNVVKCVRCDIYLLNSEWGMHNHTCHNNLSWRLGETPINLNDENLVKAILWKLYRSKKPLRCQKCKEKKTSVYGLLVHEDICGKSEEELSLLNVACEVCNRQMLPKKLELHMKIHQPPKYMTMAQETSAVVGTGKRVAAAKALDRFKDFIDEEPKGAKDEGLDFMTSLYKKVKKSVAFKRAATVIISEMKKQFDVNRMGACRTDGCLFTSDNFETLVKHFLDCRDKAQPNYVCNKCSYLTTIESDMIEHVRTQHVNLDYESETEDEDKEPSLFKFGAPHLSCRIFSSKCHNVYLFSYYHTKEYYGNCLGPLYTKQSPPVWNEIVDKDEYIPSIKQSINVAELYIRNIMKYPSSQDLTWKRFDLFESEVQNKQSTIFCGGPVWALAWVPIVETNVDQYLAVSCNRDMESFHKLCTSYNETGLIQIWNFGVLDNRKTGNIQTPKMCLGIAHSYGPIWSMEWCPRGCYQSENDLTGFTRLGLLAMASASGFIYVVSVPIPTSEANIVDLPPLFKLHIGANDNLQNCSLQATKVAWSKTKDHSIIAGGFSNGLVALWNLNSSSSLLRDETSDENVVNLLPYQFIYAHKSMITALDFTYFNDGRWFLTASLDGGIKFWDMEDLVVPISSNKKPGISDAVWYAHWNCAGVAYDNAFMQLGSGTSVNSVRDWTFRPIPFLSSNSPIGALSQNPWMNGLAQCSAVGEVQLMFPHQIFLGLDGDKIARKKRVLIGQTTYVDCNSTSKENICEDNKENETSSRNELPETYQQMNEKHGLVFSDYSLESLNHIPQKIRFITNSSEKLKPLQLDVYPIESINRLAWNPNKGSCLYLALGYQAGFVRVRCTEFMNCKISQ